MKEAEDDKAYLVVVGMNRPRLNKILSLVEEWRSINDGHDVKINNASLVTRLSVTLVPCLASMRSYEDENSNMIRYLSNVVCYDGSPMTTFLDDESFRDNLRTVLLIGYEWQDHDTEKFETYFKANQLEVEIKRAQPNPGFENLQQEMDAFKSLDDEQKETCLTDGFMGPGKMAKLIMEAIQKIENEKNEEASRMAQEAEAERVAMGYEQDIASAEEPESPQPPTYEPVDPELPRYACRLCRTILFGENHLAQNHVQNLHSFKKLKSTTKASCQSIFCNEIVLAWLSPTGQDVEGKLACPKCLHKVGHWKWAGAQCSCGTWVTPAIQIPASKVDVLPPESQMQSATLAGIITPVFLPSPAYP